MDGRASYCVYTINNRNSTIWFLFKVAPVLEAIYYIYHMYIVYDLYKTRIYYQYYIKEKNNKNHLLTNTVYISQYSDTYIYWLKYTYRHTLNCNNPFNPNKLLLKSYFKYFYLLIYISILQLLLILY